AFTIHKKIYRKKTAATMELDFVLAENLHEDTLFIIDEASMIADEGVHFFSRSLLSDLISYVRSGKNCCLMFVGDIAQLPPVGMLESPALDPNYLNTNYHLHIIHYELKEVVRQQLDSGILFNATQVRNDIRLEDPESSLPFPHFRTNGFKDIFRM